MSIHQRRPIHSETQNEEEPQQGQDAINQSFAMLYWFPNKIYECILPSCQYAVQFLGSGIKHIFQVLVFLALVFGVIYAIWKYVVKMFIFVLICQSIIGYLPGISRHCAQYSTSSRDNSTMVTLSVDSFVERTVQLAERLSETDISAPIKLTEVKISLIDLKTNVLYSQIEQIEKNQLLKQIDDMKSSVGLTTNEIHKMLASFSGALTKMEIYTNHLLGLLTDKTMTKTSEHKIQLPVEEYLQRIESEIERIIHNGESVHSMLENLEEKTDVLNVIASNFHQTDSKKLGEIENASYMGKLYHMTIGDGNINKAKYQRNLRVLNQFPEFTKSAVININNVLDRLQTFKHAIEEMKFSISQMDRAQTLPIDIHIEILKTGLNRLAKYKQRLNGRITQGNRDQGEASV